MRSSRHAVAAAVACLCLGCPGLLSEESHDNAAEFQAHPITKRFPPAQLPYQADPAFLIGRVLTYVDSSMAYDREVEPKGGLVAAAVVGSQVAVVFPPADGTGFDVAFAGLDAPWRREHLTDLSVRSVGALDAVGGPDGTLHVVFREESLRSKNAMTWVRRDKSGQLLVEPVPRPTPLADNYSAETCDDIAVGVTPEGDVDVAFRHVAGPMRYQVGLAHRSAATGQWSATVLVDSLGDGDPTSSVKSCGCRNRLAYDEKWQPVVLSNFSAVSGGVTTHSTVMALPGAAGTWSVRDGVTDVGFGAGYYPEVDLARSPVGFVVNGYHREAFHGFLRPFFRKGLSAFPPSMDYDRIWAQPAFPGREPDKQSGIRIAFTACGTPQLLARVSRKAPYPLVRFQLPQCTLAGDFAPVLGTHTPAGDELFVGYSHGVDPFTFAVCGDETGALGICWGGATDLASPALQSGTDHSSDRGLAEPQDALRIVESSPANGATDVPETTTTVTIKVSDWLEGATLSPAVFNDVQGAGPQPTVSADSAARTVKLEFAPGTLVPGATYQIPLQPGFISGGKVWPDIFTVVQPQAVLRFTVRGSIYDGTVDPRDQAITFVEGYWGCTGRDPDGVCRVDITAGQPLDATVALTRRFSLAPGAVFSLRAPGDRPIEPLRVSAENRDGLPLLVVDTDETVAEGAIYTLQVGDLVDLEYGSTLSPVDRTLRFKAINPPPSLASHEPADGATDVDPDTAIRLRFNVPMDYASVVASVTLGWAQTSDVPPQSLPISVVQEDASTFLLGHDTLAASMFHKVSVAAGVRSTAGITSSEALSFTFRVRAAR